MNFWAGTEAAVLMVESEARELSEDVMLGAVVHGHREQQAVIDLIHALVEEPASRCGSSRRRRRTRR